ncbi:MAG TPA: DUF362 domain-containing protein [bacterium]|nr:DUF362 domain-containing protein [bacterium]
MKRRDFLKGSLALAALMAAKPVVSFGAEEKAKVFVAKGASSAPGAFKDALTRVLAPMGGLAKFIKKGSRVLLKANFSFSMAPEAGTSTTPDLVRTLAVMCREAGAASVVVLDHTIKNSTVCLERTGIGAALKDLEGVRIAVPQRPAEFREVAVPKGKALKQVKLVEELFATDVYINLPIAKSHSSTTVTFGLKNQMGLILDRGAFHSRYDIHQAIADLATVARPQLTLLDASRCLATGGPGGPGKVVEKGLLAGSLDPVALDAYATTLAEWGGRAIKPADVKHLGDASALGLGVSDLAKIDVVQV